MNKKLNKIILTDADGVMLDWEYAFHTWMEAQGHELKFKGRYGVCDQFQISKHVANRLVSQFNASAHMGFLPALRDAQYYIKKLAERDGYRFVCVSSLSDDVYAQELRTCNLKKLFGSDTFVEYHYLPCGADKDEILIELANKYNGSIWVEDKYVNAEAGALVGFDALLMEHGHNLDYNSPTADVTMVKSWEDIYNYVSKERNTN